MVSGYRSNVDGRQVLSDLGDDAELQGSGYIVLPFFDPEEVRRLIAAYEAIVPREETGLQLDFVRPDRDLVRRLTVEMRSRLEPKLDEAFVDHWPVLTSFIAKHPGPDSDFYLHRDITMNDGRTNRCFTAWIPLVDVGPGTPNGGLRLVTGSEHLPTGEHGFDASVLIEPYREFLAERTEPVTLRAGEAVVYDARLLHASDANVSAAPRLAVGCGIARRSEPLVYVRPTGRRHRVVHEIDRDFFVDHHPADIVMEGMPPGYRVIGEFNDSTTLAAEDLVAAFGVERAPAACTAIPPDLIDDGDAPGVAHLPLRQRAERLPSATTDVPVAAAQLDPVPPTIAGARVLDSTGSCGARVILRGGRQVASSPDWLGAVLPRLRGLRTREVTLVVLDAGARVELTAPKRRFERTALAVVECPQVRAGVRTTTRSSTLDLGLHIDLDADDPVTIWNDGPGPTVVLLHRELRLRSGRRPNDLDGQDRARRGTAAVSVGAAGVLGPSEASARPDDERQRARAVVPEVHRTAGRQVDA